MRSPDKSITMQTYPAISAVIPTYNRSQQLSSAIQSVVDQTIPVEEIIVVDDGSTDGTEEQIRSQFAGIFGKQLKFLRFPQNRGVSWARNEGIRQARGEWVALLDSDDLWCKGKLEAQMAVAGDAKWIHGQERWIRNGVEISQMAKHLKEAGDIFERSLKLCVVSPSSVVVHKEVFESYGCFDESLPVCEDYDMWLRIAAHEPIAFCEEIGVIKHGGHEDQLSKKFKAMDYWRIIALKKQTALQIHSEQRKRKIWSEIAYKSSILLRGYLRHSNFTNYEQIFQFRQLAYRELGQTGLFG